MKKLSLIAVGVVCLIVVAGIFSAIYLKESKPYEKTTVRLAEETNYTVERLGSLVDSLNDFSLNFYKKVSKDNIGNIFFSPYSIFVALSMTYEGAQGNTATQMQSVLNILQNDSATRGSFGKIYNLLNQKQDGYTISTANAFWAQQKEL